MKEDIGNQNKNPKIGIFGKFFIIEMVFNIAEILHAVLSQEYVPVQKFSTKLDNFLSKTF